MVEREIDYNDAFVAAPGSLWKLPKDAKIWESAVTDLRPLLQAIKDDLEHLAAVTSTPLHTITPDAAAGSAEGAGLMREAHVYAVEACRDYATNPHARTIATAFAFMDDTEAAKRARVELIEPLWGPTERFSLQERADAASKAVTTLPREAIQTDIWQYDPNEVQNLRTLAGRDLLYAAATANGPAPVRTTATQVPTFQPPVLNGPTGDTAAAS
jgi:hypothetical protein